MRTSWIKSASLAAVVASISSPALAQQLSLSSETIVLGGVATVALNISGLAPAKQALGAFDVNVGFSPAVVTFESATYGDPTLGDQLNLEGFGTITQTTPGVGTVDLMELSLDLPSALTSLQASGFTLATLTFDAAGAGTTALALSVNAVADQNGNSLPVSLENGSITVAAAAKAPEIGAASMGSAVTWLLGALLLMRSRRERSTDRIT
jgi:hypothetical protein